MTPIQNFILPIFILAFPTLPLFTWAQSDQSDHSTSSNSSSYYDALCTQTPTTPHVFKIFWPPAFGRRNTQLNYYRQGLTPQQRKKEHAALWHRTALQGTDPYGSPPTPPPPWLLMHWLPGNYSEVQPLRPPHQELSVAVIDGEIDPLYGDAWLWMACMRQRIDEVPDRPQQQDDRYIIQGRYRRRWEQAEEACHLTNPVEYFRLGAEALRRHLPIGQWLAEAGITPDDRRSYSRLLIELALAAHLGGPVSGSVGRHFRLLCLDMNQMEKELTYLDYRRFVRLDHDDPPVMLIGVVACVDPLWQGAEDNFHFVPCPKQWPPSFVEQGESFCQASHLYYFRTLNDGIERLFTGEDEFYCPPARY